MTLTRKLAFGSLAVSLIVLFIKGVAYEVTGSVALFSDALESIINVVSSLTALVAIGFAAQPPDAQHPYGHGKAEYLSAVAIGVMIVLAGFAILREAYEGIIAPKPIDAPLLGLGISSIATVMNAGWSAVLVRSGRRERSAALVSDGKHLLADVVTSSGVVVGVGLVVATGILVLDSIIAALVAFHVLWSGWDVIRENSGGLLDEAAPADEIKRINEIIAGNSEEAIEAHAVRTRVAGKTTFVDFDLVVSGAMTVSRSHDICDRLEAALKDALGEAIVTIHVEPDEKAEHCPHVSSDQTGASI
jgi:cation diffusion facilitator family transporter